MRMLVAIATVMCLAGFGAVAIGAAADGAINHPVPGIWGTVTVAPPCPVGHCTPQGIAATVKAQRRHRTVASTKANSAGDYAMGLRPGTYTIVASAGSRSPHCATKTVTVGKHQSVRVDIVCNAGIVEPARP
jgi:hypothetical protein